MRQPALCAPTAQAGAPLAAGLQAVRRRVVAVVGDSSLDIAIKKAHRVTGDEACKQQMAEEVSNCSKFALPP